MKSNTAEKAQMACKNKNKKIKQSQLKLHIMLNSSSL